MSAKSSIAGVFMGIDVIGGTFRLAVADGDDIKGRLIGFTATGQ